MDQTRDREGVDRRDFMMASAASVGAAAALAMSARTATAQSAAQPVPLSTEGTAYTGDVIDGKPVVTSLDVRDLEPGRVHRLYFRGVGTPSGQYWHVSVIVARGALPGKRVVLTSGVHGDEMSS
ncbi:MAG: hypothetical protein MUF63_08280, partial [Rhodobacteraceae bacterium]|nr:hypothetical protein [Paracoccaceae bacterium]